MEISLGDRITFKSVTRWGYQKATRRVNGFYQGLPTVRFSGCADFIVRHDEISEIDRAPA